MHLTPSCRGHRNTLMAGAFGILLGMPPIAPAASTAIEVRTEGSGDILRVTGGVNHNGAMVWNGTEWVVNDTWVHKYFFDPSTGKRLKEYTTTVYEGLSPLGDLGIVQNHAVSRNEYSYTKDAADGGPALRYKAIEYVIRDVVTGKQLILRSRGIGRGTSDAYFDIYIEDDTSNGIPETCTAIVGDPAWFTYSVVRAADAVNVAHVYAERTGELPGAMTNLGTYAADYFLDVNNGADMGGKSYEFHTYSLAPSESVAANFGLTFPSDFSLKYMDNSGNLQELRFYPAIACEEEGCPAITRIKSKTSKPGSAARIRGTGFSTDKKKDVVYFGTKKATINKAKATSLKVKIPKLGKGVVQVYAIVNGTTTNKVNFTVK